MSDDQFKRMGTLTRAEVGQLIAALGPGSHHPDVMHRPPRDPKVPITNRTAVLFWLSYAVVLFLAALTPLVVGPDRPSADRPSASMTKTFVVMGLGTVFNALTNRREPASGLTPPILKALAIALVPTALIVLATEVGFLQRSLLTPADCVQWLACIGLAQALLVIEGSKSASAGGARPQAPGDRRTASDRTRPCPLQHEQAVAMVPIGKELNTLFKLG